MTWESTSNPDFAKSGWMSHAKAPAAETSVSKSIKTELEPCSNARGTITSRELRKGFLAATCDLTYERDTTVEMTVEPCLFFGINTGETTSLLSLPRARDVEVRPHCPLLVPLGQHASCKGRHLAGARAVSVGLSIKKAYLEDLIEQHDSRSFDVLLKLLSGDIAVHHLPQSQRLLALTISMLQNPYEGALSALHLESCALGLLAELAAIVMGQEDEAAGLGLARVEYERAQEVRRILEENIASPPSLSQLSRRVGINVTTMSQQFKTVFGTTVFSYVRGRRLELAQAMLRSQSIPVSQVGYQVGFSNPGAFATAYRRHFGRPPSAEPRNVN